MSNPFEILKSVQLHDIHAKDKPAPSDAMSLYPFFLLAIYNTEKHALPCHKTDDKTVTVSEEQLRLF